MEFAAIAAARKEALQLNQDSYVIAAGKPLGGAGRNMAKAAKYIRFTSPSPPRHTPVPPHKSRLHHTMRITLVVKLLNDILRNKGRQASFFCGTS